MSSLPARLPSRAQFGDDRLSAASPSVLEAQADDRRRSARIARIDALTQPAGRLALVDVSSFGCCVRHADPTIGPGHFIALHFAGLGAISGYVRWREDENMGVEFCRAIPPATERALATHEILESVRRL